MEPPLWRRYQNPSFVEFHQKGSEPKWPLGSKKTYRQKSPRNRFPAPSNLSVFHQFSRIYRVILKKVSFGISRIILIFKKEKNLTLEEKTNGCLWASSYDNWSLSKSSKFVIEKAILWYGVIQKKLFKGHFRIIWTAWSKKNFCNGILGQRTISVQIFKIFGCHQNHGY